MSHQPPSSFQAPGLHQALFESMPLGAVYQNGAGAIVAANPAAERILGLTLDQMQGRTSFDPRWRAIHEDGSDFPGEEHPGMQALRSGQAVRDVVMGVFNPRSDSYVWINITALPQFSQPGGAPEWVIATFEDITSRKQACQLLTESEERYRSLFDNIQEAFFVVDIVRDESGRPQDIRYLEANQAVLLRAGRRREEMIGHVYRQLFRTNPTFETWLSHFEQVARTGQPDHFEQFAEATGYYFDVFAFSPRPGLCGVLMTDITARKRAEKQITQLSRLYATLSQINQTIVRTTDRQELLEAICQVAIEFGKFCLAWIGLLDPYTGQLKPAAASQPLPFAEIDAHAEPFQAGLIGQALQTGKTVTSRDILSDPAMRHWHEFAAQSGCHSAAVVPLRSGGRVAGILSLFAAESDFFGSEQELKLLEEIGLDVSFAFDMLEDRARHSQAEENMRQSEEDLRKSQAVAHVGHWRWDTRANRVHWSEEMHRIFGIEPGPPGLDLNEVIARAIHPEDREKVAQANVAVLSQQRPAPLEYRVVRRDGSVRTIWAQPGEKVTGKDGEILQLSGIVQDITERKQAEEQIERLAERFNLAARAAGLGVWDWNILSNELVWDERIYELFGIKKDDFPDAYAAWLKSIHPEDLPVNQEITRQVLNGEREYDVEFRILWPDGTLRWMKSIGLVIRDLGGHPRRMVGVNFDITDQKAAEERIFQLNNELERRVQDRTAQLEAANQELEAFSYSVSHDLRAPLRTLNGYSSILTEDYGAQLDEKGRDYLRRIKQASLQMDQLINDLLNLSRVTRMDFSRQPVDLGALAGEVAAGLQAQNPGRQLEFEIQDGLAAEGDPHLLRIVLDNLLSNAFKFTSQRQPARIRVGCVWQGQEEVYFVGDNGVGFDMTYAARLFAPFQRLHRAQEFSGTGIGLATVKRIITRHGGRIWPEAEVGRGATFYFTLGGAGPVQDA